MKLGLLLLGVTGGSFSFWDPPPALSPVEQGEALASPPLLLYRVALPGDPPESAVRAEPAAPVIDGDRIYLGFSSDSALLVLDRRDGRLLGRLPAKGAVASAAIVSADRIWFSDNAGYTWCYPKPTDDASLQSIQPVWTHYSGAPIISTPTILDGTLFLANVDEQVYALDAARGDLRWRHAHKLDLSRATSLELFGAPAPVVDGDSVLVGFSDGFLVSLTREDGSERWRTAVGEGTYPDLIAPPLPAAGAILAGGFTEPLVAIDPENRAVRWRIEAGTAGALTPEGEFVYQGGTDGVLRRIEARTGNVTWSWTAPVSGPLTQPISTPIGVLVGSNAGSLYLVDAATGLTSWVFEPGFNLSGVTAHPTVVGDTVYFVSNAGYLYAFRGREVRKRAP